MSNTRYKVIQWSTGGVGREALRAVITHPDLELVGVWAHGEDKVGADAGELCGLPPTGVRATNNAEALLALDADCVSYAASDIMRIEEVIDDYLRILAAGKNVVGSSITALCHPFSTPWHTKLQEASQVAGRSFLVTGEHPGLFLDALPILLSSGMMEVDNITLTEMVDITTSPDPRVLEGFGFGLTAEEDAARPETNFIPYYWQSTAGLIADRLGATVDSLEPFREVAFATECIDVANFHVKENTVSAMYCGFTAIMDGKPRVTLQELFWVGPPQFPSSWPQGGAHTHRIVIDGVPRIEVEMSLGDAESDQLTHAYQATGARMANSIAAVCDASPGVYDPLSLGALAGRFKASDL
jgi:hypothetical protein